MIELVIQATFDASKVLERCQKFGYLGTTDEELMAFYMDMLLSPHILGYIKNDLALDGFDEPDIAWASGAPEVTP